jgi:hypothetical protein
MGPTGIRTGCEMGKKLAGVFGLGNEELELRMSLVASLLLKRMSRRARLSNRRGVRPKGALREARSRELSEVFYALKESGLSQMIRLGFWMVFVHRVCLKPNPPPGTETPPTDSTT